MNECKQFELMSFIVALIPLELLYGVSCGHCLEDLGILLITVELRTTATLDANAPKVAFT